MAPKKNDTARAKVKSKDLTPLEDKLAGLRKALLEDLDLQELQRLQLHVDMLENSLADDKNSHHHDTNQHHDHDFLVLQPGLAPQRIQRAK